MTTTFFLVRHGTHPVLGKVLAGRMANIHLDDTGKEQARRLAERLARERLTAVKSGALERARETAAPIAAHSGVPLDIEQALNEVDLGEWTGRSFEELKADPRWQQWNNARSVARAPGGESMLEVQGRAIGQLHAIRSALPNGRVAIVSHSDVIRAVLLYYLGLSVDMFDKIDVAPAAITTLLVGDWGSKLLALNEVPVG
jgi:broad specificity phosphatase PhoE